MEEIERMFLSEMTEMAEYYEESLRVHAKHKGKLEVQGKVPLKTEEDLRVALMPGVAEPCLLIERTPEDARKYTIKANTIAVVSDGSAVAGLGNIGGLAALPLIEGKALLFKELGGVDAFPICLSTQDVDEIVLTVKNISPGFGGICLESIKAPECFEIEKRLREELDIPVFSDSGQGIAAAVCAAVINSFRLTGKSLSDVRAVVCGAGASGSAITKMLVQLGLRDLVICDSKGIISASRISEFEEDKLELLELTNKDGLSGNLQDAIKDRDLFIGVSKPGVLTEVMIRSMAKNPVIFTLSNPEPEISLEHAKAGGAGIVATGSSLSPNHISSMLISPGIFRGVLDADVSEITEEMLLAATRALATLVSDKELSEDSILPSVLSEDVAAAIAKVVAEIRK